MLSLQGIRADGFEIKSVPREVVNCITLFCLEKARAPTFRYIIRVDSFLDYTLKLPQ
jgi:hypothetical protein